MQLFQQAELMDDAPAVLAKPVCIAPRVLSITMSQPSARPNTGVEWQERLNEAFTRAGGLFLTLHNSPEDAIARIDSEARKNALCLPFMPFSIKRLAAMVRIIRQQRIDIIVWHFMHPLKNPYVWALSVICPRVRHWLTDHVSQSMPLPPPPPAAIRFVKGLLLRRYGRVICVSDFVAGYLAKRGYRNIVTNYLYVDPDRLRPDGDVRARMRRELDLEGKFAVLFAGHVIREKGGLVALEALAKLPGDAVLVVLGDGPALDELKSEAATRGLSHRVRFVGRWADVTPFMQSADVAICPSLWAEAAGLVNMEAQSCGLPVVASRIGGIPEIVEDGRSGMLFEPGDANALASCLKTLKGDAALRKRMGEAGRARVIAMFSPAARIPIYLEQYSKTR
jgi:glycosyltransferase involved in cell wall biosynthesis